ncbi:MAG: MBL fold metallo-hydrolase [Pseudomonadales bacterium]
MRPSRILFILIISVASGITLAQEVTTVPVADNIYMLQGKGGNVGVIVGEESMLVIDDDYADMSTKLHAALKKLSDKPMRFLVNTHWHGDHVGGNEHFGPNTNIVAHTNVRKRMSTRQEMKGFNHVVEATPASGLPVVTYQDGVTLHAADQTVQLKHFPAGHTDGDSVVFIKPANVVHMGDHYFANALPFVDLGSGGSVQGFLRNVEQVLKQTDANSKIIPGHGPLSTHAELREHLAKLKRSVTIIRDYQKAGLSAEQAKKKGLPKAFDDWQKGFIKTPRWVDTVYGSYKQQ